MFNDLMENIEWFFNLHDKNKDGFLTKDEVLTVSESFLVLLLHFWNSDLSTHKRCRWLASLFSGSKLVTRILVLSVAS